LIPEPARGHERSLLRPSAVLSLGSPRDACRAVHRCVPTTDPEWTTTKAVRHEPLVWERKCGDCCRLR
jgi:hypothetical protein